MGMDTVPTGKVISSISLGPADICCSAGTVAGITWGVAKEANLIAVRVLDDNGSGALSDVVDGIEWSVYIYIYQ